jgi:hypothetical protein
MEKTVTELQVNHLEIAARAWAAAKTREIAGLVVDQVLNQTQATIPVLELIQLAETYEARFLTAWLHRNLMEFTRAYMSDVEERARQVEKLLDDRLALIPTAPIPCGQPERDARILAEAQTELLAAIETVLPYLPDRNDAKDYAATNDGRASSFQVAAIKLREVYSRNK